MSNLLIEEKGEQFFTYIVFYALWSFICGIWSVKRSAPSKSVPSSTRAILL
jgi:hypothetical protein